MTPIKFAFNLCHQVVINMLHFTDFDEKMDAVIETAVQKLALEQGCAHTGQQWSAPTTTLIK